MNVLTVFSLKVISSSSILNSPFESHPKVDSTLTLVSVGERDFLNVVFVAILKLPFTLASLSMISYKSSPSYLPS